jgi:hypothetical protein
MGNSVDRRHLQRLQKMDSSADRAFMQRLLKLYLKEIHLSNLHLRLVTRAIIQQRIPGSQGFAHEVDDFVARTRQQRERVMVEVLIRQNHMHWSPTYEKLEAEWRGMLDLLDVVTGSLSTC